MFYEVKSSKPVAEIAKAVEAAAKAQGFGLLGTHDLHAKLNGKGVPFTPQCLVFEVCDPHKSKAVLEADARMASLLPCRIAAHDIGGAVVLSTVLPSAMLPNDAPAALKAAAVDVEARMKKIMEALR